MERGERREERYLIAAILRGCVHTMKASALIRETILMVVRAVLMFVQQEQSKVLAITLISTRQYVGGVACVAPCVHQGLLKPLTHLLITSLVALQVFSTITGKLAEKHRFCCCMMVHME